MKKVLIPLVLSLSGALLLGSCNNASTSSSISSTPTSTSTSTSASTSSSSQATLAAPVITLDKTNTRLISWANVKEADSFNVYLDGTLVKENLDDLSYAFPYDTTFATHVATVKSVKGDTLSVASNEVTISNNIVKYNEWSGKEEILGDWDYTDATNYKSDVGEGFDFGGVGSISIAKEIKSDNKYLSISVRDFVGQEEGNTDGSQYTIKVNGTIVKAKGYDTDYVALPLDTDCWYSHSYDLTSYVGNKVIITMSSINSASSHLVFTHAVMDSAGAGVLASGEGKWDTREKLIAGWRVAGNYRDGVGEGFDINSYDDGVRSSCSTLLNVSATKPIMVVRARVFSGQDANEHHMVMRVNGKVVRSVGASEDYTVQPGDTDAPFDYYFDLSDYAGKQVEASLSNDAETGHMCLQSITFTADKKLEEKTATEKYYHRTDIGNDWTLCGKINDVGEGYDLNSSDRENNDEVRSSIQKQITVSADNVIMLVNFRQFKGQEGDADADWHDNNAKLVVRVNGETLTPVNPAIKDGKTTTYVEDDLSKDGQGNATGIWSLQDYIGKTVLVNICADERVYHCVLRSIGFAAYDTATSWDHTTLVSKWGISGDQGTADDGLIINPWDGKGGAYIATTVAAATPVLKITALMSNDSDTDDAPVELHVNDKVVAEAAGVTTLVHGAVAVTLTYDLTAYAGKQVVIGFCNGDDNNNGVKITAASFVAA